MTDELDQADLDEQDPELLPERSAMTVIRMPAETPMIVPVDPDAPPAPDALLQPTDQ